MQGLCTQGLHAQGWWGHSVNQITQGLHARGCMQGWWGHSAQSDYTGVACKGLHAQGDGDTQPI